MPVTIENIKVLIDWLGVAGARAGLEGSHLSVTELRAMAQSMGAKLPSKSKRADVVEQLILFADKRIDKSLDEMLAMSAEALMEYFEQTRPNRKELLLILESLDFHPGSEAQRGLYKYAARQISETGMFQRVAGPKSR